MATKYFALLTNTGAAKLANATALGAQVEITQMAVGDGNGVLPTPNPEQTALTHELRRAQLNTLTIDPENTNQIIAEQVIPEDVGGWWIREIGLFDKDGDMIAVANCAETYKPQLQEGSGRTQIIRVILIVSSTESVTLKIDPSVVLATRKYVDDAVIEVKTYADDVMAKHIGANNPHSQYPLIESALKEMKDAGLNDQVLQNLGLVGGLGGNVIGRISSVNFYTASTTHVRGDDVKKYLVILTGAGAGGGSQTTSSVYARSGGAGGTRIAIIDASNLPTVQVTIGSGGAPVTPLTSVALEGNAGGDSLFGSLIIADGGTANNFGGSSSGSGWAVDGGDGSVGSSQATATFGGVSFWGGGGVGPSADATLHDGRAPGSGGAGISSAQARSGRGMDGCCLLVELA